MKILWECCQIPDFVKKTYGHHLEVVSKVFNFLISEEKKVPNYYMKKQLSMLDKLDGNVDSISNRISNVRTWSYVANKKNWVENSDYWVQLTKNIEDKLSDKLHDELTKSFIDKKISILSRGLKQDLILDTQINEDNKIFIDGQFVGELKGLKFQIEITSKTLDTDIKSIKKLPIKNVKGKTITLGDLGEVKYGPVSEKTLFKSQSPDSLNENTVGIGIYARTNESTVTLSKNIRKKENAF